MLDTLHTAVPLCSHGMGCSAETGRGGFGTNQNFLALLPTLSNTGLFLEVLLVLCVLWALPALPQLCLQLGGVIALLKPEKSQQL